jgi:hypothetical protein
MTEHSGGLKKALIAAFTALAAVLILVLVAPSGADVSTRLQTARDMRDNCQLATTGGTSAQRTWAQNCVADMDRVIAALTSTTTTTPPATTTTTTAVPITTTTTAPPPPGSLMGWQVTSSNVGLAPLGLSCGSLPPYSGPTKPAAGSTITGMRVSGYLDLSAGGITITRSCIQPTTGDGWSPFITTTDFNACCAPPPTAVTVTDSEIDGSLIANNFDVRTSCAFRGIATLERNYMHDIGSGICILETGKALSAVVRNNYVTRLRAWGDPGGSGSHNEALTVRGFSTATTPTRTLTIDGNRLEAASGNDSGAAFNQTFDDAINNVAFQNNLFACAGNYDLVFDTYGSIPFGGNIDVLNNRFGGTGFGPGYSNPSGLTDEWSGNYVNDPSQPDNKGAAVAEW